MTLYIAPSTIKKNSDESATTIRTNNEEARVSFKPGHTILWPSDFTSVIKLVILFYILKKFNWYNNRRLTR